MFSNLDYPGTMVIELHIILCSGQIQVGLAGIDQLNELTL